MTDDLSDFKALMDAVTPPPDSQRRAQNLQLAQANFKRLSSTRPKTTEPTFWVKRKAQLGGVFVSLAAVAAAVVLVVPSAVQGPSGPVAALEEALELESSADFALAPLAAPQAMSRSVAATALTEQFAADAAGFNDTPSLTYDVIRDLLKSGKLPDQALVAPSAFLSAFAGDLLADQPNAEMRSFSAPWDAKTHLVVVATPQETGPVLVQQPDGWRLLGQGADLSGTITVYLAPSPFGEPANEDTFFAAAITGFGLLLTSDQPPETWTFETVTSLAQKGGGQRPHRAEVLELMTRAQQLSRQP